ncbi:MAG TPA: hypothetical protein VK584_08570, partial [Streptosporangiaceae bacterium]|nr:hypothetical protein [Streptosporangiaceae bacterium]
GRRSGRVFCTRPSPTALSGENLLLNLDARYVLPVDAQIDAPMCRQGIRMAFSGLISGFWKG